MIKIFAKTFSNLILSLRPNFFRTSLIKYDETVVEVIPVQTTFGPVETALTSLAHRKGAVNFANFITKLDPLLNQAQGNKALFLFTNGTTIDRSKILELEGVTIFTFTHLT